MSQHEPNRRAEATRTRLLAAAEEVFAEQGFFRASVSEITRRAGVAQGTFYLYFKSKEEIFRELVRQLSHDLRRELQETVAPVVDRRDVERVGLETFLRFVSRRRNLYKVMRECEVVDPDLHRWYYQRMAEGYVRGLRQGMARGQIRPLDPEAVAYALMGAFQMIGLRWVLWQDALPPAEAVESILTLILHGLDPSGSPAAQAEDAPVEPAGEAAAPAGEASAPAGDAAGGRPPAG
jgi:AcrR family transcriptional regulator